MRTYWFKFFEIVRGSYVKSPFIITMEINETQEKIILTFDEDDSEKLKDFVKIKLQEVRTFWDIL